MKSLGGEQKNRKSHHRFDSGPPLCTYYAPILYSRPLLLFPGLLSVKSRLAAYRKCPFPFSLPSATMFDGSHRISFLSALALSPERIQYVLCAYARKFKYLLFVIKFGRANRMGILHRDCAMQRDGSSLSARGNGDLHIDRYFILLPSHFVPVYRFSRDTLAVSFLFLVSGQSRIPREFWYLCRITTDILVPPSSPFNLYPYLSTTCRLIHLS